MILASDHLNISTVDINKPVGLTFTGVLFIQLDGEGGLC
jgi:hypothetical protein